METREARVGDVWRDNDTRGRVRTVLVTALVGGRASGARAEITRIPDGRRSQVLLEGDGSIRGYTLVRRAAKEGT